MADNTQGAAQTGDMAGQINVLTQYVRDQSFENPGAPGSLRTIAGQAAPEISISVDVNVQEIEGTTFECVLHVHGSAKREGETLFVVELAYGGLFHLTDMPRESVHPVMLIEAPRLLFPFARRIIADMTRDGGFPPLMLDPVDFAAMYRQQLNKAPAGGQPPQAQA